MLLFGSGFVLDAICYRMNYDCLGKKIVGYEGNTYRFTGTFFFTYANDSFLIAVGAEDTVCGRMRRCTLPIKKGTTLKQIRKVCTSKQARRFVWLIFINCNAGRRSETSFSKVVLCQFGVSFWASN